MSARPEFRWPARRADFHDTSPAVQDVRISHPPFAGCACTAGKPFCDCAPDLPADYEREARIADVSWRWSTWAMFAILLGFCAALVVGLI